MLRSATAPGAGRRKNGRGDDAAHAGCACCTAVKCCNAAPVSGNQLV
ncbi:hypothetical protein DN412_40215 [Cupriavidus lacunae]|uniref:Uncharacterized protein n=1 Tax=Cupriavidus lacunae TaxID=2666307 RepID=A0A370NH08_9BURK|nr:hypothetical protein DN412_40215 [Cupriavidus lacunae]